ncbi:MAG: 2OG-Fe dioxygenase family protein [Hyphomonadaceae bacterium]
MPDTQTAESPLDRLAGDLAGSGYAILPSEEMRSHLSTDAAASWAAFADSWNDLGQDIYMADGGRYRRRRHAVFRLCDSVLTRLPHQPHFQSRDYNTLNGGVQRWFEPVLPEVADNPVLHDLGAFAQSVLDRVDPLGAAEAWRAEMHQFRIEAQADAPGLPTPEGMHRDGVDWVMVLLVNRTNVEAGVTRIAAPGGESLGEFVLERPLDAVFVDDHRVFHGVTPVTPRDATAPAFRDALVLTFRREDLNDPASGKPVLA